jgi:hypothetical protein
MKMPTIEMPRFEMPRIGAPKRLRKNAYERTADRMMSRVYGAGSSPAPFVLAGAVAGYVLAYFLDPDRGNGRRIKARDRAMGFFRRQGRSLGRMGRRSGAEVYGMRQKAIHEVPDFFRSGETPEDTVAAGSAHDEIGGPGQIPPGRSPLVTGP